jgi:hypothetical protein
MNFRSFLHSPNGHFARHYVEMVIVMFAGMLLLGLPAEGVLRALGSSSGSISDNAPAMMLLWMAVMMTAPMVAWMRYRGHGWRANSEMAASMFIPTVLAIGLMAAGALTFGAAMGFEHALMLPSMLIAMLLRRDEYSTHAHHLQPQVG